MTRQRSRATSPDNSRLPMLLVPRQQAEQNLKAQIEQANRMMVRLPERGPWENIPYGVPHGFAETKDAYQKWDDYTIDLLKITFDRDTYSKEFQFGLPLPRYPADDVRWYRSQLKEKILFLESLMNRLHFHERKPAEPTVTSTAPALPIADTTTNDVFLVHGHNAAVKHEVARFLERLGLRVTILHEQPNQGRTILEKFEHHAHPRFAVVLLTGDDVGGLADAEARSRRARQNVIFELGYFFAQLGRANVVALLEKGVERPSDIDGLLYIPLDGDWKLQLVRELRAAHFEIDLTGGL